MRVGYHASHEQFAPSHLLELVKRSERAGFEHAMCSDHIHPWSEEQGESGFAWSWLGAAMQATGMSYGVVTAPVQRYNPAIIAQAGATLTQMFPGRFWMSVGSGQALNEAINGGDWPPKDVRNERLLEAAGVIRALWRGERVLHSGLVQVREARLYSLPGSPPDLLAAAVTAGTARWAGGWADGLITISRPIEELRRVVEAFRAGGGEGKPVYVQVKLSYSQDEEAAVKGAWEQWRFVLLDNIVNTDLRLPEQFTAATANVRPGDVRRAVFCSPDPAEHARWLEEISALGVDAAYLHNVNREQERFLDVFGEKVLPRLGG